MTIVYPDDSRTWGVDVSFYQDDNNTPRGIDFQQMRAEGATFAFIRAGQYTWEDPDFRVNWEAAREAGLLRGAYWFLDARGSGRDQAWKMAGMLMGDWGELPPVVDYEHKVRVPVQTKRKNRTMSVWKYNTPAQLDDFISALGSAMTPMIYTGYYYWMEHGSFDKKYAQYPLWIAGYGGDKPRVPPPWSEWTFWQFTDNGPGKMLGAESEHIDLNYSNDEMIGLPPLEPVEYPEPEMGPADLLDAAPRMGAEVDEPEGSRYIQLSDTLALSLADRIREECS